MPRTNTKVKELVEEKVASGKALLLSIIGFNSEAVNVANLITMKKGDNYMSYIGVKKLSLDYPSIRKAIAADLETVPHTVSKVNGKDKKVYPWGTRSISSISHSLAVSMLKTAQRRSLKFGKNEKLEVSGMFKKFDKSANKAETITIVVTKKSVYKDFDLAKAQKFLAKF